MRALMLILALGLGQPVQVTVGPGESLTVHDAGEGPAVVLMPGLAGCAYGYRNIVPGLQDAGMRTLVIEPLGFGSSGRPRDADYSLTAQADRVAAVMDARSVDSALIVAHGVSASVALRLAYRRPDLVRAVLSIEGGPSEVAGTPTLDRSLGFAKVVVKVGGGRILRDRYRKNLEAVSGDRSWIDRKTLGRYLKNLDRDLGAVIDSLRAMSRTTEPESLLANLGNINCPVLLMVGEADHEGSVPEGDHDLMRSHIADFTVLTVPGAGHYIFEEQPEAVTEGIHLLLAEADGY